LFRVLKQKSNAWKMCPWHTAGLGLTFTEVGSDHP